MHRLDVIRLIDDLRVRDAIAAARLARHPDLPPQWPALPAGLTRDRAGIARLLAESRAHPWHPDNVRRRALDAALASPRVREIHWRVRRSIFRWEEFRTLRPNAVRLLETVIDLAREEAFPWILNVQAEHVMFLARFDRKTFFDRLRDLEALAITRPAQRIVVLDVRDPQRGRRVSNAACAAEFPSPLNNYRVPADAPPPQPIPQWVMRYRRGIPHNARRAAWWINYDLLCETARVLPCFEVSAETLARDYRDRRRWFGAREPHDSPGAFARMERNLALRGPLPPIGLRAALWNGL